MPYFSRLTDIVTCSLSALLDAAENPRQALEEIIYEMQEGVAGAQRSVRTATENVARLETEIGDQRQQVAHWVGQARVALTAGNEPNARRALLRKHEVEDLIAGLEQQLQAAVATRNHLRTTQLALEARLADALRRQQDLGSGPPVEIVENTMNTRPVSSHRGSRVEEELAELRRQLGGAS